MAVSHVASRAASLPILSNVLLSVEGGSLKLTTTNLELAVLATVWGKVEGEGSVTVNCRVLTEYVSLVPHGEQVTLEVEGTQLRIVTPTANTSVQGLPATDFPLIPKVEPKVKVGLPTAALREALSQVTFAASTDDTRPEISGVFISIEGGEATLVSTDSYRLAERKLSIAEPTKSSVKRIVPLRTVQELTRVLATASGEEVTFVVGESQSTLEVDGVILTSRNIEGQFPDYQQIVPTRWQTRATVPAAELMRAVRQASLFCKPGVNDVKLNVRDGGVSVSAANATTGEHSGSVPATIEGQPGWAVFNYRYILDGLGVVGAAEVALELTSETNPATVRPVGGSDYTYVIMPIRQ